MKTLNGTVVTPPPKPDDAFAIYKEHYEQVRGMLPIGSQKDATHVALVLTVLTMKPKLKNLDDILPGLLNK